MSVKQATEVGSRQIGSAHPLDLATRRSEDDLEELFPRNGECGRKPDCSRGYTAKSASSRMLVCKGAGEGGGTGRLAFLSEIGKPRSC